MISRRNYIVMSIIMLIVLFLFQFSQIVKSTQNDYIDNDYEDLEIVANHAWSQETVVMEDSGAVQRLENRFILFVGDVQTDVGSIVSQWTRYTRRQLCVCSDIASYVDMTKRLPEFLIVDSNFVDFERETELFSRMSEAGVSIVFCNMPANEVIESNEDLKKLMGISYIKEPEVTVEGIKLFAGFLLGGETIYEPQKKSEEKRQDMELTMPWYVTAGGTKTYMVGIMDDYYEDYKFKNELFPAIIWRNSLGTSQVFCVCGDYMSQTSGLGILSAMIYELSDYQLYPVVNAQNTLLINYPLLAYENSDEFYSIYSRSVDAFQREVIWPTLVSLAERYDLKYTSFVSPKYDYEDPAEADGVLYEKYLELLHEKNSEVGVSLRYAKNSSLKEKLAYDSDFYATLENYLVPTSGFLTMDDLSRVDTIRQQDFTSQIRTFACREDVQVPILSYVDEGVTLQSLTSNTKELTYSRDLRLKSIETTLGFDNAELDLSDVIWPENQDDHWQISYNGMSSALSTYWKPFRVFDRTTLTESDQRVRVFLNLDYVQSRKDDVISLTVDGRDGKQCWFIMRTHGDEIIGMDGGSYKPIEDDAYLLTIDQDEVRIRVQNEEAMK